MNIHSKPVVSVIMAVKDGEKYLRQAIDSILQQTFRDFEFIIIDDCSHIGEFTALSFWHLFDRHLKPGGLYVIEDWGTGYMRGTPDGKAYVPPRGVTSLRSRLRPVVETLVARG